MKPRLDISFPLALQKRYWCGEAYIPAEGEYLLNHARSGIVMALCASLPNGGRVGVMAYNCHTVANAVMNAGCTPVFADVTEELLISIAQLPKDLDAIVVTNLFGIRNNIDAIRARCPHAIIIVDNAHGYGLPAEGDFTVYSINQGKFPSLGEGGILITNEGMDELTIRRIQTAYNALPSYGIVAQVKLFCSMLMKAVAYSKVCYWLTRRMKKSANHHVHERVVMKQMAPGVRRLYKATLPTIERQITSQIANAGRIANELQPNSNVEDVFWGENAFMAIARSKTPQLVQDEFAGKGVETATHFNQAIDWATEFGYKPGSCPTAERLVNQLLMIPTYTRI